MSDWTLHNMDCLEGLRTLPDESVQCCVTSPPYWGLRDYGVPGQLGLEATPEEYVANMVEVFREVRRVLRPDGTLWLNLGDSYAGSWGNYHPTGEGGQRDKQTDRFARGAYDDKRDWRPPTSNPSIGLKPKNLVGIPWRVAFALQADGWWLRSDIVWAKPNPMPESVADRPTRSHEFIFLLTKSERYYYDHEAIAEPAVSTRGSGNDFVRPQQISRGGRGSDQPWEPTNRHNFRRASSKRAEIPGQRMGSHRPDREDNGPYTMRNKRSVWTVATQPFSEAHFAVFPPKLIEPCILAGSRPGDTVLDPFAGAGTTLMVATQWGRKSIGFELNPDYCEIIRKRLSNVQLRLQLA